ncbi:MAG: bifunctional riboflavin kinase/FAD synthetase [Acidimicrobiia bacterium]
MMDPGWILPEPSAVTVGVFDGVHRGHARLIGQVVGQARARDLAAGVLTFDPHPVEVLAPEKAPLLLTTLERRVELLMALDVDWVGVLDLGQIRMMSPEQFVTDVLVGRAASRLVAVGEDFRFGHDRAGDVSVLTRAGERHGFEVTAVDLVADGSGIISSSRIRAQIAAGRVDEAADLLGRAHRVSGPVISGEARGRTLDYPTANLACPAGLAMPADGIYAVRVGDLQGVASLGVRPTFGEGGTRLLEVHLFDFDGDLYGKVLDIDFIQHLRGEERFDSVEDLVAQMARDAAAARSALT